MFHLCRKPTKKLGAFCWLALAIAIVETLICVKFGQGTLCSTYLFQSEICSVGVLCKSFIASIFALSEDCLSLCCSHCLYFSVFSAKCLHESYYEFYNLQVSTPSRCLAGLFGLGLQLGLVSFCSLVVGHTNSTP